mmetsp:Transcript_14116/g.28983  ORF Transcript_14116/g.28983 Transcript_14116/m.28983 type:complete len:566 (-) Transcript_14116:90-1787(-)
MAFSDWREKQASSHHILFESRIKDMTGKGAVFEDCVAADRGSFAVGDSQGSVHLYSEKGVKTIKVCKAGREYWSGVTKVTSDQAVDAAQTIFVGTKEGDVFEIDLRNGKKLRSFKGHKTSSVCGLAVSGDTLISATAWNCLTAQRDKMIRKWDLTSGMGEIEPAKVVEAKDFICSLAISPKGTKFCVGCRGGKIYVHDLISLELLNEVGAHTNGVVVYHYGQGYKNEAVQCLEFSRDGERLYSGGADKMVMVWDTSNDALSKGGETQWGLSTMLSGHEGFVMSLSESPCGNFLASGSKDSTVRVWDVTTGVELRKIQLHQGEINGIIFEEGGEGGKIITASSDGKVKQLMLSPSDSPPPSSGAIAIDKDGSQMPIPCYFTTNVPALKGPFTSEKNMTLLSSLISHDSKSALDCLQSPGFPVDVNCVHRWRSTRTQFASYSEQPDDNTFPRPRSPGQRDFGDIKCRVESALVLAIKCAVEALGVKDGRKGAGTGTEREHAVLVVREMLERGADVEAEMFEDFSRGSWPSEVRWTKPIVIARQGGDKEIVEILSKFGAVMPKIEKRK